MGVRTCTHCQPVTHVLCRPHNLIWWTQFMHAAQSDSRAGQMTRQSKRSRCAAPPTSQHHYTFQNAAHKQSPTHSAVRALVSYDMSPNDTSPHKISCRATTSMPTPNPTPPRKVTTHTNQQLSAHSQLTLNKSKSNEMMFVSKWMHCAKRRGDVVA